MVGSLLLLYVVVTAAQNVDHRSMHYLDHDHSKKSQVLNATSVYFLNGATDNLVTVLTRMSTLVGI